MYYIMFFISGLIVVLVLGYYIYRYVTFQKDYTSESELTEGSMMHKPKYSTKAPICPPPPPTPFKATTRPLSEYYDKHLKMYIFHGGCLDCISQHEFPLERCEACQYRNANWDLPDLSMTSTPPPYLGEGFMSQQREKDERCLIHETIERCNQLDDVAELVALKDYVSPWNQSKVNRAITKIRERVLLMATLPIKHTSPHKVEVEESKVKEERCKWCGARYEKGETICRYCT